MSVCLFSGIFKYVQNGTCESNGLSSIHDEMACSYAAYQFGKSSNNVIFREGNYGSQRPIGCSWHPIGNLELWESSNGECNINGYDGCFCMLSDFA